MALLYTGYTHPPQGVSCLAAAIVSSRASRSAQPIIRLKKWIISPSDFGLTKISHHSEYGDSFKTFGIQFKLSSQRRVNSQLVGRLRYWD
jgi:hypothetical protein